MGITGTPTFLVGRVLPDGRIQLVERLQGAKSVEEFGAIIDKHLKAQ